MAKIEEIPVPATVQPVDLPLGQVPPMNLSPIPNTPPHAHVQVDEDGIGQGDFEYDFEEVEDEVGEEIENEFEEAEDEEGEEFEGPEAEDEEGKFENEEYEIEKEEKTEDSVEEEKFLNKETSTEDEPETLADSKKKDELCPTQTETFVEEGKLTGEVNETEGKSSTDYKEDGTLKRKRQEGSGDFMEASDRLELSSKKRRNDRNDQMSNLDESTVTKDMQEEPGKKKIGSAAESNNNKDSL